MKKRLRADHVHNFKTGAAVVSGLLEICKITNNRFHFKITTRKEFDKENLSNYPDEENISNIIFS